MAEFKILKIDNTEGSAIKTGKWSNPGAKFYDQLLNAVHSESSDLPAGSKELDEAMKKGTYGNWDTLLREAYLIAPVGNIKNSPHGVTPFSRSGCKYPHHAIRDGKLVVSIPGLKAAYSRACQQGDFKGEVKAHLMKHFKEMGMDTYYTKEGTMLIGEEATATRHIDENFDSINLFIMEKTGINLFDPEDIVMTENTVIPAKNFEINLDKWKAGCPLWIAGASGDGKSTLAEKMANENGAEIITCDIVLCRMGWTKEKFEGMLNGAQTPAAKAHKMDLSNGSPAIDYIMSHPNLPYEAKDPKTRCYNSTITDPEMIKFLKWLIKELKTNPKYKNKKYIIEGCDICLMDPNIMVKEPLIIVGGSRLRSFWRRVKRDTTKGSESIVSSTFKYIKKYNLQARRLDDNKDAFLKRIKKVIKENVEFQLGDFIVEAVIEGPPNDPVLTSDFAREVGDTTPQALWDWMHANITYDNTISGWHLRNAVQLYMDKKGNCHDQAYFAAFILNSWHYSSWMMFFVEFKKDIDVGGNTHTLTYYLEDGKYYWFENAWEDQAGIHGPFNSKEEIKQAILDAYAEDNDLNSHKFDGIVFGEQTNYRLGMTLGEYVESWTLDDDRLFSKGQNEPEPSADTIQEQMDWIERFVHDDVFRESVNASNPGRRIMIFDEDTYFKVLKSDLDDDFEPKGELSLSDFTRVPITKELTKKFKDQGKLIKWMRDQSPKYDDTCWLWMDDNGDYVGAITYDSKYDKNHHKFLSGIDVAYRYTGYGLGKQLLDEAINDGVNALNVQTDNMIALKMYKDRGFKISPESQQEVDEGKSNTYEMYYEDGDNELTEDGMTMGKLITQCSTPEELHAWMDCLRYGWFDKAGKVCGTDWNDDETKMYNEYRLQSPNQLIRSKVGVCWDCTALEAEWFHAKQIPYAEIYVEVHDHDNQPSHTFVLFQNKGEDGDTTTYWFEHCWDEFSGIHEYGDLNEAMHDVIDKFVRSHDMDPDKVQLLIRRFGKGRKYGCTMQEYMDHAYAGFPVDLGDLQYDEIFCESRITIMTEATDIMDQEIPGNHQAYTMKTLPKYMYFASRNKHTTVQNDRVFMTPYPGIASIFIIDTSKAIAEEFKRIHGHYPERLSCNTSYKEWEMEGPDLIKPLKHVHVNHNVPTLTETIRGRSKGFIHVIDITDIRDQLKLFSSNDPDREVYYDGGQPLKPVKIIEHSLKWEMNFSSENMKHHGEGIVERADALPKDDDLAWMSKLYMEADEGTDGKMPDMGELDKPIEDQPAEAVAPEEKPAEEPAPTEEAPAEEPPAEDTPANDEPPKEEAPKKESRPKKVDRKEHGKNGVRRKKLYMAFIDWCKAYNPKNTFGSIFDEDAFTVSYPFVPEPMRYFYRLANPMLCVLAGDLTFFHASELAKINKNNPNINDVFIFAGTPNDLRVWVRDDRKIYKAVEKDGKVETQEVLGDSFDLYIQNMIGKGDILYGPIGESTDEDWA